MIKLIELILIVSATISLITTIVLLIVYKLKKDNEYSGQLPKVTVFVPFYNENTHVLRRVISCIESQDYPNEIQVLLIDDGSTNSTLEDIEGWISVPHKYQYEIVKRTINQGRKGYALDHALQLGIATGEVYIVVDSDTFIQPNGIIELVQKLWSHDKYAAVCGYITPSNYKSSFVGLLQHYEHISFYGAIRTAQDKLGFVPVMAGAFVAHRASVVKELGGWSEWLVEDIAWCWKAISNQYKTGYAPKAKAKTQCPLDTKSLFKQRRRWARGRVEAYKIAWKTHWFAGLCSTPWFFVTATQYIFPSTFILLRVLAVFNIWIPIVLASLNFVIYFYLVLSYINDYDLKNDISLTQMFKAPVFKILLECITWLPNLFGYIDELSGKKKIWLTR